MVDVNEVKAVLLEVARDANGQKAELRSALIEVLQELEDSPADRIRAAMNQKSDAQVVKRRTSRRGHSRRNSYLPQTSEDECVAQIEAILKFLESRGPCEVATVIDHLVEKFSAISSRPDPRATARGRITRAVREGQVAASTDRTPLRGDDIVELASA